MESPSGLTRIPESGGTNEPAVAQLLRLPSRSGLAVSSPLSPSSYTREVDSQLLAMYSNQVGGHRVLIKPLESSIVLKPYDEAEFDFYDRCVPLLCSTLMPFTARCYGEVDLRAVTPEHGGSSIIPGKSGKFVMLEDLAHGIARPCILDLKMGLKQRSIRNYSEKKILSKEEKSKSTTSHTLGFRLCGAQIFKGDEGNITFYNKYFGRLQDEEGTFSILQSFFDSVANPTVREKIIDVFLKKLSELRTVIRKLSGFRFWSGSLLLIVDSAVRDDADPIENAVILKMIDFANYTQLNPKETFDMEYDFGIDCLSEFLQSINKHEPAESALKRLRRPPDPCVQDKELLVAVQNYRASHKK